MERIGSRCLWLGVSLITSGCPRGVALSSAERGHLIWTDVAHCTDAPFDRVFHPSSNLATNVVGIDTAGHRVLWVGEMSGGTSWVAAYSESSGRLIFGQFGGGDLSTSDTPVRQCGQPPGEIPMKEIFTPRASK